MRAEETVGWSLIALGNTFDAVAKTLNCTGIQGVRNTVRILNPIVRYLLARFPNAMVVDVIRGDAVHIVYHDGSEDMTPLPLPVTPCLLFSTPPSAGARTAHDAHRPTRRSGCR
jgi:hypothetical protein